MDTLGSLIDKSQTVKLKIEYINNLNKKIDLGKQLFRLRQEIDDLLQDIIKGDIKDVDIARPQHKTY